MINKIVNLTLISLLLFIYPLVSHADKIKIGVGTGLLYGGADFIISYRPNKSHLVFNLRHGYDEVKMDGVGPNTTEKYTSFGPIVDYYFTPQDTGSFYASTGILKFTLDFNAKYVTSGIPTNENDSDSGTAFVFGGGYTQWLNESIYYDLGISFGLGKELYVETSVASMGNTKTAIRIIIGLGF